MLKHQYNFDDERFEANNSHACISQDISHAQLISEVSDKYQEDQGSQIYKQMEENPSTLPTHNSKFSQSVEKQLQEPQQKKYSNSYHLEGAGEVRPNLFMGNGTSSPVPQSNEVFTMKPHQPEPEYDPYKKNKRNQRLKKAQINRASSNAIQDETEVRHRASRRKSRRPPSMSSNSKSNNLLSLNDSTTVVVSKPEKQAFPQQIAQESTQNLFNPMSYTNIFQFVRDSRFGANYMHPDFSIKTRDGISLISSKKQYCHFNSYYSLSAGMKELGCLRGNFGGSQFNLYRFKDTSEELVATIAYKTNLTCTQDFRRMEVFIKKDELNDLVFDAETKRKSLQQLHQDGYTENIRVVRTKQPTWSERQKCYTMSFGGKGKLPSIKNMILLSSSPQPSLLFCKSSKNTFHMQLSNPLSLFISMGILMSSFDFKLFCQ